MHYSDRPHGITLSAVADCSTRKSFLLLVAVLSGRLPVCLLSVLFPFTRLSPVSSPRHTRRRVRLPRDPFQIVSRISRTFSGTNIVPFLKTFRGLLSGYQVEDRRRTLVAKRRTKRGGLTPTDPLESSITNQPCGHFILDTPKQYISLLPASSWLPRATPSTQTSFLPLSSRACSLLP